MNDKAPADKAAPNLGAFGPFSTPLPPASSARARIALPTVPDHELLRCIGRGSYGEVWLARNVMGAYRAVKVVYRATFDHDRPFEREFEGIQNFEPISRMHDSQVDILHVGRNEKDGYFYYVMELADDANVGQASSLPVTRASLPADQPQKQDASSPTGKLPALQFNSDTYVPKTIRSEIRERGRLPIDECLRISLSLTTALEHLHRHGLIHRDIKPSNIIFVDGVPKLADLGMVASVDATLSFVGTEGFLPPEGPGTVQADIYSLGKVLYEVSMGRDRLDFPKLPPNLDQRSDAEGLLELNEVLIKACANDVRQRYQSSEEMHADLALLQSGKSVKRLRTVEHRLAIATKAGLVAAAIALVTAVGYFGAIKQAQRARNAEQKAANRLYAADMNLAQQSWDKGNVRGALELLETHRSGRTVKEDLRGFEWFYLWRLCHQDRALRTFHGHTAAVNCVALSPDGRYVASGGDDNTLRIWDAASAVQLAELSGHTDTIRAVAFSPDGKTVATASGDNTARLWDFSSRQARATLSGHSNRVFAVAFSPNGKLVASGSTDTTVKLWQTGTGDLVDTLDCGGLVFSLAISPDGKKLAAGCRDEVKLWDLESRRLIGSLTNLEGFVMFVAFSPDSQTLASGGNGSLITLWNVETQSVKTVLSGHDGMVKAAAFSPDGALLVSGSDDHTARVWDLTSDKELLILKGHLGIVTAVAFAPDNHTLVTASADSKLKLWDTRPKADRDVLNGHEAFARGVAFLPDLKTLVSCSRDKTVRFWDARSGEACGVLRGHQRPIYRFALSPDGETLATVGGLYTEPRGGGEVKLWDVKRKEESAALTNQEYGVYSVAFSRDGKTLATGDAGGAVTLWNVASKRAVFTLPRQEESVDALAFSADGKVLALGGGRGSVKLWDLVSNAMITTLEEPRGVVACHLFLPDPKILAVGADNDGSIKMWNIETRQLVATISSGTSAVYSLAVSPDGKTLAEGDHAGTIKLWNLATLREVAVWKAHRGWIESLAFSPDGSILASASADKTVRLLRAATRAEADTGLGAK